MKLSKFILLFLISCFVFQFVSNSLLGSETRLFPMNDDVYPGMGSSTTWKSTTAAILYPIKVVLIGPLSGLFKLPDPPPPMILLAFALYWTIIATLLYFLVIKIRNRKKI